MPQGKLLAPGLIAATVTAFLAAFAITANGPDPALGQAVKPTSTATATATATPTATLTPTPTATPTATPTFGATEPCCGTPSATATATFGPSPTASGSPTPFCPPVTPSNTELISVDSSECRANDNSSSSAISADGRFVAFDSLAANLIPGDTNGVKDIFLRDRQAGTTERVSVDSLGGQANGESHLPSISADGRFVVFSSYASNLVAGDTNNSLDVFLRDRQTGTTERISVRSNGSQADFGSEAPAVTPDGRFVAFMSGATNLVPGDTNGAEDIFVRDRVGGTTERVSVSSTGQEGNAHSEIPDISADGRYVAFYSNASNLVPGDTSVIDIFVRDRLAGVTEKISVAVGGGLGDRVSDFPAISADGRYVTFESWASNLVSGDTNGSYDIFLRDRMAGTTERVSVNSAGGQADLSSFNPDISADSSVIAFESIATNLIAGDTNGSSDVYVRDLTAGITERASVSGSGGESNGTSNEPSLNGNGLLVSFSSSASNLVDNDTNARNDIFVRDRIPGTQTPTPTPGTAMATGTATPTPPSPTPTPTVTPTPCAFCTPTATATATVSPSPTPTSTPTVCEPCITPQTRTPTAMATASPSPTPTVTAMATPTTTPTATPTPTVTPTPAPTATATATPAADSDNDGWSDVAEGIIGTNPLLRCGANAWPPDINSDTFVDISDVSVITSFFGQTVPPAPARDNIAPDPPDGFVDITDVSRMTGLFGQRCT